MNCLTLLHEYNAKITAWEQTTNEKEFSVLEKRLLKIREIFNDRHDSIPTWEEAENCLCE